jgi:hypothetical protein
MLIKRANERLQKPGLIAIVQQGEMIIVLHLL